MAKVTWRAHPVYTEHEASNDGRIRFRGEEIRQRHNAAGYFRAHIGGQTYLVHRFICEAFNGMPESRYMCCRHLNDFKWDNRPQNLAWGWSKDNAEDKKRNRALPPEPPGTFTGPSDIYHRFMAGETLTWFDLVSDESVWDTFPMTDDERERLQAMIQRPEVVPNKGVFPYRSQRPRALRRRQSA